jgi:hypothetical protein
VTSRAGPTLASLAATAAVTALAASCALVTGISKYTRVDCEGDCDAAAGGSDSAPEAGLDASVDADGDVRAVPFSCGGVTCAATEYCCGSPDAGTLRCSSSCGARDVLVQCNDDSQCSDARLRCCGVYDDTFDDIFTAVVCKDGCAYPLCPNGGGCSETTVCKPLLPLLAPICTPK